MIKEINSFRIQIKMQEEEVPEEEQEEVPEEEKGEEEI